MRTLVLNAGYEPIYVVSWQRAITLVLKEKAEMISSHSTLIRSVSRAFAAPKIIRLVRYISILKSIRNVAPYSRTNVFKRDGFQCQYCFQQLDSRSATIDHIVPQSKGGGDSWENTVCCCQKCNRKKGNKSLKECGLTLARRPKPPTRFSHLFGQLEEFDFDEVINDN